MPYHPITLWLVCCHRRVGYGAFPLGLIHFLWRAKQPYNVSVAAEVAAVAALSNLPYIESVRDALVAERQRLFEGLAKIPYLEPCPSHSNFVLCKVAGGRSAQGLKDALAEQHGIMVRHYSTEELNNYVRVSVGCPEHTASCWARCTCFHQHNFWGSLPPTNLSHVYQSV